MKVLKQYGLHRSNMLPPFSAERVLVLSELSIREKERHYSFLIRYNAKFRPIEDGRFVGNIRILAPNVKKSSVISSITCLAI